MLSLPRLSRAANSDIFYRDNPLRHNPKPFSVVRPPDAHLDILYRLCFRSLIFFW